jgi:hypothetical protein
MLGDAMKGNSPTQRTLRELRKMGRTCGIVERFNQYAGPHGVRQDLFGFIDLIALDPIKGIVGVQSCGQSHSAHKKKILGECRDKAVEWVKCGGTIELWSWTKRVSKRGSKLMRWTPRVEEITLEMLENQDDA